MVQRGEEQLIQIVRKYTVLQGKSFEDDIPWTEVSKDMGKHTRETTMP